MGWVGEWNVLRDVSRAFEGVMASHNTIHDVQGVGSAFFTVYNTCTFFPGPSLHYSFVPIEKF